MAPKLHQKEKKKAKATATTRVSLQPRQNEEDASGAGYHTTPYQIDAMVRWLEVPANYNIIAGASTSGKKMAHGGGTTKIAGFRSMAEFVYGATIEYMRANVFFDAKLAVAWEAKQCQSRWNSIFRRYRAARTKLDNQTGFGLTEEMVAAGKTVEDLAEECCPCFKRIDHLFGGNANVTPPSELSEPFFNDTDWFPVQDDPSLSGGDEGGHGMTLSQNSSTIDASAEQENIDPNSQSSDASRSEAATTAAASSRRAATESSSTASSPATAKKKKTTTSKPRKSASKTKATTAAKAKGVDKAANLKRKDFGSVYTEASKKRQAFNEEKFKVQMEWKQKLLMEERREKELERQARARELQQKETIQRIQAKQTMALELLKAGKSLDEVEKIVDKFFPDSTSATASSTEAEQGE